MKRFIVLLLLAACGETTPPLARVWTVREYVARRTDERPIFGGWAPKQLVVATGETLPFSTATQGPGQGLPVFPAVADSVSVGFNLLDIWQDHPDLWIQPVYIPSRPDGSVRVETSTIFAAGLASTFYSPWWRQTFVKLDDAEVPDFVTPYAALKPRAEAPLLGGLVLCPIMPGPDFDVAAAENDSPRHPITNVALRRSNKRVAFVDGVATDYIDFGLGRAPWDGQVMFAGSMYVFITAAGVAPPLAVVLPSAPRAHGFLYRVEVPIPAGAKAFVPSNRPDLRAALGDLAPDVDPALDVNQHRALQLVRNPACLTPQAFSTCNWLDSEKAVQVLEPSFRRKPVQVSIAVLDAVTP